MLDTNMQIKRQVTIAVAAILILGGGSTAWSTLVPLEGAVTSTGTVMVENAVKKVQHQSGGIVGEIRVREGQQVKEGELLVRLDETMTRANLAIVTNDLTAFRARQARLLAERAETDAVTFPKDLVERAKSDPDVAMALANETKLFETRWTSVGGQKAQLRERVGQLRKEIEGLEQQRNATVLQLKVAREEFNDLEPLRVKGLVPRTRVTTLEREIARNDGVLGDLSARVAQAQGRISETELQIGQVDRDRNAEVSRDLREVETKVTELNERRIANEDQLRRVEIRAPITGVVHQLTTNTVGGVINPAEPMMMIVPETEQLIIEARVAPQDIDQIRKEQSVRVRFTSFNQRTTPEVVGTVFRLSPDTTRDPQTGASYYTVAIRVNDSEFIKLNGARLVPGMLAEAYFKTDPRTLMSFLLKPLSDNWHRTFSGR